MMRLRADIAHANATRGGAQRAIAECGFSVETGLWTYKMLRPDKVGVGVGLRFGFWDGLVGGGVGFALGPLDGYGFEDAPNLTRRLQREAGGPELLPGKKIPNASNPD